MYGLGMAKGFAVTLRNFFRKPVTVQYPEERVPQHSRFRGQSFVWYEERCTGCASCAKYCPLGIIKIVTDPHDGGNEQEGGSYKIDTFDIDQARCMYCGLCVEACPYDALHMGTGFDDGKYQRVNMVLTREALNEMEKHPASWYRPQLERQDYDPYKETADWRMVGREPYFWHPKRPGQIDDSERKEATADGEYD